MQYFLAYEKNNGELVKISEPTSSDFYDILSFTLDFDDNVSILKFFKERLSIPNNVVQLYYCSQSNKKDKHSIKKLYQPYLVFKDSKLYFDPVMIREYLFKYYNDIEFIDELFVHFMQKYGLIAALRLYLEQDLIGMSKYELISKLNRLKENVCDTIKEIINDLIEEYDELTRNEIDNKLNYIIELITTNKYEYINFYSIIKNKLIKLGVVSEFPIITELYKIRSLYYYSLSFKDYNEAIDYRENIENLFKLMLFKYDYLKDQNGKFIIKNGKRRKGFIVENGEYVVKSRDLYDLGCLIKDYENKNVVYIDEEDFISEHRDEKEEFLTEDDYLLMKRRDNDEYSY